MKVMLQKNYKDIYTVNDLERAKRVIQYEREDEFSAKDWAEYAVREALRDTGDYLQEVLKAEAHTSRNCKAWNCYDEDSQDMDVWLEVIAKTAYGFVECGAYLSDVWQTGAIPYKDGMWIQHFTKLN